VNRYVSTADEEEQSEEDEDAEEEEEDEEDDEADAKGELLSMFWKSSSPIHTSIPSIQHVPFTHYTTSSKSLAISL
jgi:TATA-binding protein-associated factor Taf7